MDNGNGESNFNEDPHIDLDVVNNMVCGGYTHKSHAADQEIQDLCDLVKKDLETKTNKQFKTFKAICYKTQVVSGTNYSVKIDVGNNNYIHVVIYQHWSQDKGGEITSFEENMLFNSEL
jgi:cystatin-A/B